MEKEIWEKSEELHNSLLVELCEEWDELKDHMIEICHDVFNTHGDPQRANEAEVIKSLLGERFYELCVITGMAGRVMNKTDEMSCNDEKIKTGIANTIKDMPGNALNLMGPIWGSMMTHGWDS